MSVFVEFITSFWKSIQNSKKSILHLYLIISIFQINLAGLDVNMIQNATDASNIIDCNEDSDIDNHISRGDLASQSNSGPSSYDNRQTGCSSNPCLNQGQCYPLTPTEYKCSCLPGFAGRNCEHSQNICEQNPCQNQGICRGNSTHYVCSCSLGYTGANCDQSEC